MDRVWKIYFVFIALLAVLPIIHELIHSLAALSFGYAPVWIEFGWEKWTAKYTAEATPLWAVLLIRYSPELVFLPIAYVLTWKFRTSGAIVLVLPFLFMAVWGFRGHSGLF